MGVPPVVVQGGLGARVWDVDGRVYLDYLQAFGPGILGHGHPAIVAATEAAVRQGPLFGTHHPSEGRLADLLSATVPTLARVRFTASGTEAVMSAVRLARAVTGRRLVVKFDAGYHGHSDAVLGHTGSAAAHAQLRGPAPDPGPAGPKPGGEAGWDEPAGVPGGVTQDTVTLPWNDAASLRRMLGERGGEIACVLTEPIAGNIGIVPPDPLFTQALNDVRSKGALLIADEVVSGFRFRFGDASSGVGLKPDLVCFGKIVGGGFPIGAYGGRAELMSEVSPEGPVFQAGTYAGHPVAMSAGLATLHALSRPGVYEGLTERARELADGLVTRAHGAGVAVALSRVGPAFTLWPGREGFEPPVRRLSDVEATDSAAFARLYRRFLAEGVLLAPSRYEAWFVTLAHRQRDIAETLRKAERVFGAWNEV